MSTPPFNISDEMIEAATRAIHDEDCDGETCGDLTIEGRYGRWARSALEAVAPLIAVQVLRSAYWKLREHASALRGTEVYRKASERKEGTLGESPAFQRYRWLEATARGIEDGARDIAELLGVEECDIDAPGESGRERSPDPDTPAKRLASLHAQPHFPIPSCPPTCHCYGTAGFQQWAADGHGESDAQRRERSEPSKGSEPVTLDDLGPYSGDCCDGRSGTPFVDCNCTWRRSLTEDTP